MQAVLWVSIIAKITLMANKISKRLHYHILITGFVVLALSMSLLLRNQPSLDAQTATVMCQSTQAFFISPTAALPVTDRQVELGIDAPLSYTNPVKMVRFYGQPSLMPGTFKLLGSGVNTPETNSWRMWWDSRSVSNDIYQLSAEIYFAYDLVSGGGNKCRIDWVNVHVENTTNTPFILQTIISKQASNTALTSWTGYPNTPDNLMAFSTLKDPNNPTASPIVVSSSVLAEWNTTIGYVTREINSNYRINYNSGSSLGNGVLTANITYGGQTVTKSINVSVVGEASGGTDPIVLTDGPDATSGDNGAQDSADVTTNGQTADGTSSPKVQIVAATPYTLDLTNSNKSSGNEAFVSCLQNVLEPTQFEGLKNGETLAYKNLGYIRPCLAPQNYLLPTNIAPIHPDKVRNLQPSSVIKIDKFKNFTKANNNENGLMFSGLAPANSDILIYIFSQPLVITTKADENGNWSYVLENPLEPGNHEAYVAMEHDGKFIRSDRVAFAIEEGEKTTENPNGYSLILASASSDSSMWIYIIAGSALVLITSVILARFVWFRKQKPLGVTVGNITPPEIPADPNVQTQVSNENIFQ